MHIEQRNVRLMKLWGILLCNMKKRSIFAQTKHYDYEKVDIDHDCFAGTAASRFFCPVENRQGSFARHQGAASRQALHSDWQ